MTQSAVTPIITDIAALIGQVTQDLSRLSPPSSTNKNLKTAEFLSVINQYRKEISNADPLTINALQNARTLRVRIAPTKSAEALYFKDKFKIALLEQFSDKNPKEIATAAASIANRLSYSLRESNPDLLASDAFIRSTCNLIACEAEVLVADGFSLKQALEYLARFDAFEAIELLKAYPKFIINRAMVKPDPASEAARLSKQLESDFQFLKRELADERPEIAKTLANQVFIQARTESDPHAPARKILMQYRADVKFLELQLEPEDGAIARSLAGLAAFTRHDSKRPYGLCNEFLQRFRSDMEFFRTNLNTDESSYIKQLASMSMRSKRTEDLPYGKAPQILERFKYVRKFVEVNLPPEDNFSIGLKLSLLYADAALSHKELDKELNRRYQKYKDLLNYFRANLPDDLKTLHRSFAAASLTSGNNDPSVFLETYKKLKHKLTSQPHEACEKKLIERLSSYCAIGSRYDKAIVRAERYLSNHRNIRSWVAQQRINDENNLAWAIANQAYKSNVSPQNPLGRGPELLTNYRSDRNWLISVGAPPSLAHKIASISFYSSHSKDLPYGNAAELYKNYQHDLKAATAKLSGNEPLVQQIVHRTFFIASKNRTQLVNQWIGKNNNLLTEAKSIIPACDHGIIGTLLNLARNRAQESFTIETIISDWERYCRHREAFEKLASESGRKVPCATLASFTFRNLSAGSELIENVFNNFLSLQALTADIPSFGVAIAVRLACKPNPEQLLEQFLKRQISKWVRSSLKDDNTAGQAKYISKIFGSIKGSGSLVISDTYAFLLTAAFFANTRLRTFDTALAEKIGQKFRVNYNVALATLGADFRHAAGIIAVQSVWHENLDRDLSNFRKIYAHYEQHPRIAQFLALRSFSKKDPFVHAKNIFQGLLKSTQAYTALSNAPDLNEHVDLFASLVELTASSEPEVLARLARTPHSLEDIAAHKDLTEKFIDAVNKSTQEIEIDPDIDEELNSIEQ